MAISSLLSLAGRYANAPFNDFTIDDWSLLDRASSMSLSGILHDGLRDIFRPFYMTTLWLAFRLFGDHPAAFCWVRVGMAVLLQASVVLLAFRITRKPVAACASGLFFALLPNISQPYHFHAHSLLLYIPILYIFSFILWDIALEKRSVPSFAAALTAFFVAVFSYEYGVFLILLYPLWALIRNVSKKWITAGFSFAVVASLYLLWRFTHGFGVGIYTVVDEKYYHSAPPHFVDFLYNIRCIASWWIGGNWWGELVDGWRSFLVMLPRRQAALVVLDFAIATAAWSAWKKIRDGASRPSAESADGCGSAIFLVGWFFLGSAPYVLFVASSRHNLFPAVAISILAGIAATSRWRERLPPGLIALFVALLVAEQGIAKCWREVGALHRGVYESLAASRASWRDAEIVLFDTASLRQRLTGGLLVPPSNWETNGDAIMPRGFAYQAMLNMLSRGNKSPRTVLDAECDAHWNGNQLVWHERFNPALPRLTPREKVFVVDCFAVGAGAELPRTGNQRGPNFQ